MQGKLWKKDHPFIKANKMTTKRVQDDSLTIFSISSKDLKIPYQITPVLQVGRYSNT